MSTKYQILDDRPIDKWKVTELREELKKRKLTTRGLKKDLVKRLDDALRIERAKNAANEADDDGDINPDSQPIVEEEEEEAEKTTPTTTTTIVEKVKDVVLPGDCGTAKISVTQTVVMEVPSIEQHVLSSKQEENVNSNEQIENEGPKIEVNCDSIVGKREVKGNTMEENVDISLDVVKPETVEPYSSSNVPLVSGESHPTDDERDVNSNTQIENEGPKIEVSCDSIDEKIEVKGNTMDDNVERCLDVVKPEMVEPYSSSNIVLVSAESHPKGDEHDVNSNVKIENEGPKIEVKCDSVAEKSEVKGNTTDENVDIRLDVVKPETAEPFSSSNVVLASAESHSTDHEHDVNSNIQIENEGPKTEVKCDSIDKKIEVKDNTMEDNVETNVDAIKPETVEPYSSSNVVQASGESHPTDDEHVQPVKNEASVDGTYDHNNESGEMGYSEKLNLDRSSGDESMEEDLVETKQVDSKCSADEILGENSVKNEALVIKEESPVGVGGVIVGESSSTGKKEERPLVVEKRKMHDMEAIGNNEPTKRHKLDPDNLQLPEEQDSNLSLINTSRVAASKSTSDFTDSENTPKERVVPPSQKPPTTSLRVDQFLRPFTLKAVQELLGKTGIITSFWMDHIKTHCYVTYSSVEEAIETRNAIYNLQWPPNGGRQLVAEFVDPHQVEIHLQTPPATTTNNTDACGFTAPQQVSERKPSPSQRSSNSLSVRSRQPIPPTPPEEPDSPMATIDDIFWKTKATPKIYYLPLSQEQVAAKQARRATKTSW